MLPLLVETVSHLRADLGNFKTFTSVHRVSNTSSHLDTDPGHRSELHLPPVRPLKFGRLVAAHPGHLEFLSTETDSTPAVHYEAVDLDTDTIGE